jgi:hypothetical protein
MGGPAKGNHQRFVLEHSNPLSGIGKLKNKFGNFGKLKNKFREQSMLSYC